MKLLIFGHSHVGYFVPNKICKKAKEIDRAYHSEDKLSQKQLEELEKFISDIEQKYKPIEIGHMFTGDLG